MTSIDQLTTPPKLYLTKRWKCILLLSPEDRKTAPLACRFLYRKQRIARCYVKCAQVGTPLNNPCISCIRVVSFLVDWLEAQSGISHPAIRHDWIVEHYGEHWSPIVLAVHWAREIELLRWKLEPIEGFFITTAAMNRLGLHV